MVPFTELMIAKSLALGGFGLDVQLLPCWKSPPISGPFQTVVTAIALSTASSVMHVNRQILQPPNTLSLRRICESFRIASCLVIACTGWVVVGGRRRSPP